MRAATDLYAANQFSTVRSLWAPRPQWSLQKRPTVITSKPANGSGHPGL